MLTLRHLYLMAVAASLAITALPHIAEARDGGHGGMAGRMGTAPSHVLMPYALTPHAAAPGGKQTSPRPPSQSQAAAAAAAAAASTQSTPIPTSSLPPSAIAAPATQVPAIAPLSASPGQIIDSSGGGPVRTDLTASSAASSASPSESAPSAPGGGGDTLQACMGFWDRGTHMSKVEWRAACTRTLDRLDLRTPVP
jgi:hypothetical protein